MTNEDPREPKEDTLRETPSAKASDSLIPVPPADWVAPPRRRPSPEAQLDVALGRAHLRTWEIRGPLAWVVGVMVLAVVALIVVFAVGVGAALAAVAAVAGALGVGVAGVRRLAGRSRQLPPRDEA